jgi:hypothetical protein
MKRIVVALVLLAAALSGGVGRSQAVFVATSTNTASSFTTAASFSVDNVAPTVSLTNPGTPLTGTRTLYATAGDTGGSSLAAVAFEYRLTGSTGAWSSVCTDTGTPYSCPWDTAAVADGLYDVRATASDGAGNSTSSTAGSRRVDNTAPSVALTDDGVPKAGTLTLAATAGDGNGTGVTSVRYEYRTSGGGTWAEACTSAGAPFSCSLDTTGAADGLYDLRAIATDGASFTTTSSVVTARIDNTAPSSATITNPGTPLSGSVTLNGAGADAVGLASMRFEYRATGSTGAWSTACTDTTPPSPFSCSWDTTAVGDGSYDLRSVAIDQAGNTRTSATVAARIVDNNGPAVSVTGPAQVRGTTNTVTTSVTDALAITSVVIRYRASGSTGASTTICTDTTGPTYTCNWNVSALADASSWELTAVATDALGRSTTSAPFTSVVNSTGPTGTDVQSTNGGTNDRLDSGDRVIFTFSAQIAPSSILSGWNGTSTAIRVRVNDSGSSDSIELYDAANTTPLNLLAIGTALMINGNHVSQTSLFNATIERSGSTVTVTIGSLIAGAVRNNATGSDPMVWQTNPAMTDTSGRPLFPTTVTESGSPDVDF